MRKTARKTRPGRAVCLLVFLAFAVVPAVVGNLFAEKPRERRIHVESFRYGKDPSVIRVNRGDRLRLTFNSRDAPHSFFLEEFDLDAKIHPGRSEVDLFSAAKPEADFVRQREVVFDATPSGPFGILFSRYQYRCHVWCGPMHAFEHGVLVIAPNTLLLASLGGLAGILFLGFLRVRWGEDVPPPAPRRGTDLLTRFPRFARLLRWRGFQFAVVLPSLILLQIVILTSIVGTQMSGRNLGVMLLWVVWLFFLVVVFTPLGGRIWCLACPLPFLGEAAQRGAIVGVRHRPGTAEGARTNNRFFGLGLPWPSALANAWPRNLAFLVLGTFSVALVARPEVTGWVLLGLVAVSAVLALIFEHRSFCRYLCPIQTFVGLYGAAGKLALRARDLAVCAECKVQSCLTGGLRGWACPYGLHVEKIRENNDCGLCTECLKTCPNDNIGLFWRPFAEERGVRSMGEAWIAVTMLMVGLFYCAVYLGPWPALRDLVNILDKDNWGGFALYALLLWAASLVVFPALLLGAAEAGRRLAHLGGSTWTLFRRSSAALVPVGLGVWATFTIPMLLVNRTFVMQSISDPLGRGDHLFGMAGAPWRQGWPQGIPWLQAAVVLVGLGYSLRNGYRIWREGAGGRDAALRGFAPLALFLTTLSIGLLCFFTN